MNRTGTEVSELCGHRDLKVYQLAYSLAMQIFEKSKTFPNEERYSLTSQIRRSSRSRGEYRGGIQHVWGRHQPSHRRGQIEEPVMRSFGASLESAGCGSVTRRKAEGRIQKAVLRSYVGSSHRVLSMAILLHSDRATPACRDEETFLPTAFCLLPTAFCLLPLRGNLDD